MSMKRPLTALLVTLLAASAWGQAAAPLNLKLPPSELPAASSTTAPPSGSAAPGVYYGDTSGRLGNDDDTPVAAARDCDDSTYNQPQVHGSVSTGVVSGRRIGTGTWGGGTVNLSKAFGSCDQPRGGVSISVGAESGHFRDH